MSHAATETLIERLVRRYARWAAARPVAALALLCAAAALCGWYGSGIAIRSDLADLFPDSTPAVQVARHARETLKSSAQMTLMFGSPDPAKNRALAAAVCDRMRAWPDVAALDCRRDVGFFRRNAALFLSMAELEDIDREVAKAVQEAAERGLVDDALTEGLDNPAAEAPASATATDGPGPATATDRFRLPTDDDLKRRFASDDIREWNESEDASALAILVFPTIPPTEVDKSAAFVARVRAAIDVEKARLHPTATVALSGDYAEMTAEIDSIRGGLVATSVIALLVIAAIQVLHFRRWRALALMSVPLIASSAFTVAFARGSLGYLNVITAFIFSMLFGMGNDFNVYTLSRYLEERSAGKDIATAVEDTAVGMVRALHQAALTTSVAFFALVVLEFRGFSQFGLLAGVGVEIALACTLLFFPPLTMVMHRLRADAAVSEAQAQGSRWMGAVAQPRFARAFLALMAVVTAISVVVASGYRFETDFRKLRSTAAPQRESVSVERQAAADLEVKVRAASSGRTGSPVVIVADTVEEARLIHDQIEARRAQLPSVRYSVSIHTFVPARQDEKMPVIARIRTGLEQKLASLDGKDRQDAERAIELLRAQPYGPRDLPEFVRNRFLDKQDGLGRFVILYARGNLAEAESIRRVMDQIGRFSVPDGRGGEKVIRSTASFFILAEADDIVRKEGPIAVALAAVAVFLVIFWHFRNLTLCLYSFLPLTAAFAIFLAIARSLDLSLNLFSVTALPGILGIGIDGTTHILHRWYEEGETADVRRIVQQVGGAAWVALVTTTVGFAALLFQDNRGMQTIAWMATIGLFSVCLIANLIAGALLAVWPPRRSR